LVGVLLGDGVAEAGNVSVEAWVARKGVVPGSL
jgi:hypothetical protein